MTEAEFLALAKAKYDSLQTLKDSPNFYDYEKSFDEIWTDLGRQVLEKNIGEVPSNHRKKTLFGPDTAK
jgi:hypothetical protein